MNDLTAAEKVAEAMLRGLEDGGDWTDAAHEVCRALGVDPDGPDNPVAAETERCAALVDDYEDSLRPEYPDAARLARHIAAAIRDAKAGDDG